MLFDWVKVVYVISCDVLFIKFVMVNYMFELFGEYDIVVLCDGKFYYFLVVVYCLLVFDYVQYFFVVERLWLFYLFE